MNGLSFSATTEKRKGILLDPRTKLILLLTITTLMFSTSNEGIMNIVKPCLSLVPFALILSERRFKTAGKYLVLYAVCFILERIALTSLSGLLSFIVLAVTSIMTRFAPGIMTGAYLISSTSISEFIGAMGSQLVNVHICDWHENGALCLPCEGNFDFDAFMLALKREGYDGPIIVEPYLALIHSDEKLRQSLRKMEAAEQMADKILTAWIDENAKAE